jgi:predicted DNA-binding transcriptional regulator AlpA
MPAVVTQESRLATEPLAFTIDEFAEAYRLSRATIYNLWRDGEGPTKMRVRGRVLISRNAAEKWRAQMEADSGSAK